MSICFSCKFFKQTSSLTTIIPGHCSWDPDLANAPYWIKSYLISANREVWNSYDPFIVKECRAHIQASAKTIEKREKFQKD